jgi:hypothetical protein
MATAVRRSAVERPASHLTEATADVAALTQAASVLVLDPPAGAALAEPVVRPRDTQR